MNRPTSILISLIALFCVATIAFVGLRISRMVSYAHEQRIGADLVLELRGQRPDSVSLKTWDDATGWAITAYHNVCFSEEHVPFDELVRFNQDARVKLASNVNLSSIDWIWQRLAETGPHGRKYVDTFEPEYRSIVYGNR